MINKIEVGSHLNSAMMGMSAYALLQRAIPDYRDGFKPVHRRIITSMVQNKTLNFTKSATVEGRIMQLHPHGGSYGSIVGLVQKDRNNLPFLIGKGSWGQNTSNDHTPAAARYTEVKLGDNALEITKELKENSVDYVPNYDGTIMVPEVLPVTYPSILTQSQSGMAIGFASSTLSYNIHELYDAIEDVLMMRPMKTIYPDFPTGASIIEDDEAAKEIIRTGRGSLRMRAKIEVEGNKIIVHEIPYGAKREAIINKIIDLNKQGKLKEVTDVRDGTSFKGMKIVVTVRKNADIKEVIAKLYKWTALQSSVSSNLNVLIDGKPQVVGVEELLIKWLGWRMKVIRRGMQNKIDKMMKELNVLIGLRKITSVDEAIKIIRFSKDNEVEEKLMKTFDLNYEQAEYIGKMTLRSLNEERIQKKIQAIDELEKEIDQLKKNEKNDGYIKEEIKRRMKETIEKINAPKRRTNVITISEKEEKIVKKVAKQEKIGSDHDVTVTVTKNGWAYKTDRSGKERFKILAGDEIRYQVQMKNNEKFTTLLNDALAGLICVNDIDETIGIFLPTYFEKEDYIACIFPGQETNELLLGYNDGHIVRVPIEQYSEASRRILKNAYWKDEPLVLVHQIRSKDSSIVIEYDGKVKNIDIDKINVKQWRASRGQSIVKVKEKVVMNVE
ncbi:DNA topoisomerase II [Enterococcus phage 9183]|uniref:DNA topoisomerase IV subunit A n=1 Tax=Enterococcus phage 9183 TaxID=2763102 RepID=A0A7L7SMB3_9CAUD|nr:DNA topoisomerase II [Enterococcus phage 9183]QOC57561.1 DNA topoisomerase IV subunit A [Enterococcus phage 9183]